jgi:hyaluronoglucosaminidase
MNASKQDFILGVVEGFYGVFYTFPERRDLIRFIGQHGYNLYVYAPKNDRQHRARWWEAYPPKLMAEFTETVQVAHQTGVQFCYAISPGGSLCYASEVDFQRVTSKLQAFFDIGVRSFSLMLDDLESKFRHPEDAQRFDSLAQAQADMANRLLRWLKILDPRCTLSFVPGEYSGRAPFSPTIHQLGALLDPAIDICYTGPEVCSPEITGEDARDFANAAGRPPIIWDNYPVNDLDMQPELHLAPVTGRSPDLLDHVKGILVNPMIQAEASKIPLWSYADYVADPRAYHPADSWETAVQAFAGADYAVQLRILAENTIVSCLGRGGQTLDTLSAAAVEALMKGRKKLYMIGNAHIDPVWLWQWQDGFHETKATFRSALDRMNEYPDFCICIQPAAIYEWVEQSDPAMFAEIQQRVAEGAGRSSAAGGSNPTATFPRRIVCAPGAVRAALLQREIWRDRQSRLQRRQLWPQRHAAADPQEERHALLRLYAPLAARERPARPPVLVGVG